MAQFKKFSASESQNYDSGYVGTEGELTWDPTNGLRLHDGDQNGGRQIGITSYQSLNDLPTNLANIQSGSNSNNRQFLRYNSSEYAMEFADDFRVITYEDVDFPGGNFGADKAGDIAIDQSGIYYCYQEPNTVGTVQCSGASGYGNPGWIQLNSVTGSIRNPIVGDKFTDGAYTSTVAEAVDGGWNGSYGVYRMDPPVGAWRDNASHTLTVFTGNTPQTINWAKLSTEIVSAPAHNNSPGIVGQIAYDSNYMYRCTQSTVTEISATYKTPKFTDSGYTNQGGLTDIIINNDGVVATPQVGWTVYDIDTSSSRVITNVSATTGQSGSIWILSYTGDLDFGSVTQVRLISQEAVDAVWKRVALSADTW